MLRVLTRLLQRSYEVLPLSSPTEALRRIAAGERWSVILCDVMMPEMTGLDLARRIREADPQLARRIVFMTGGTRDESIRAALERSAHPLVHKPIEPAALRRALARVSHEVEG